METEKAYKLLAEQEGISNGKAKTLIDKGLVRVAGRKVTIARGEIDVRSNFAIKDVNDLRIIFQDDDIMAVDKPAFLTADEIARKFPDYLLLNRLDKETSGVMLFAKNKEFQNKAISEFKANRVYKEYVAVVEGKFIDETEIDKPILTIKHSGKARSTIDKKAGKSAKSTVYPMYVEGNKSKVKIVIDTGRTHQIRVHLNSIGFPIIGDGTYGKLSPNVQRVLLHSKVTEILGYKFEAKEPREFRIFGLE